MDISYFNSIPKEYTDKDSSQYQKKQVGLQPEKARDRFMLPRPPTVKFGHHLGYPSHVNVDSLHWLACKKTPGPGAYNPKDLGKA
jgi:hypothetical protein